MRLKVIIVSAALVLLLSMGLQARASTVKVRIFSNVRVELLNVSIDLGAYRLEADGNAVEDSLQSTHSIQMQASAGGVKLSVNGYDYGTFREVRVSALDTACILCLNPKNSKQRTYEGSLRISTINSTALMLLNEVDFETYIAGVVQSEIYGSNADIFKVQAVISRTWALRNINKHRSDGYNFCDQVHCQAYLNRCVRPDIMLGTVRSMGQTIVDANGKLIETPFHSNSGGQTANSEDVWREALPYLRSIEDTFSYRMRQSEWTKVISQQEWLSYFAKKHNVNVSNDSIRAALLSFDQPTRKARIMGVPLTRVRVDWKLKSTFFSVNVNESNSTVTLRGRGYGHGVGLSQEGTIRMVTLGYSYDSIISHYYKGAHIHFDTTLSSSYVNSYIKGIEQIIADDLANPTRPKNKKDDWLSQLFRIRNRVEREEVYEPSKQELERDWEYEW